MNRVNQVLGAARVPDLLAERTDVSLEEGRVVDVLVAPDLLRKERVAQHLPREFHHLAEDLELKPRAIDVHTLQVGCVVREVQFQLVEPKAGGGGNCEGRGRLRREGPNSTSR